MQKRRPPPHIRSKLDFGHRITGQSLELFSIRPAWDNPSEPMEFPIAKATFVRTQGVWNLFWQRADLKGHGYETDRSLKTISAVLAVVDRDEYGCFFG